MSEQDTVDLDTSNQTADDTSVSDTDNNGQGDGDSANDEQNLEWYKEQNIKLFNRAKEAEGFKLVDGKWIKKPQSNPSVAKPVSTQQSGDMSSKDLYSLMEHKVPSKHIDEVVKASKVLGMSIQEALEDGFVQARLKTLAEEDQTANATNTGGSKRTTAKITDEQLVQRYMEGKDVDPEAFAQARMNLRKKK